MSMGEPINKYEVQINYEGEYFRLMEENKKLKNDNLILRETIIKLAIKI